jgi:hypothetical protein
LAKKIAGENDGTGSTNMIDALIDEPDTSEFGKALKASKLDEAARQAERINQKLSRSDVSREELLRMQQSLKRVMQAASQHDKTRNEVGKRLNNASQTLQRNRQMLQRQHGQQAGQQFRQIAQNLRQQHQRQQSQRRLQQLARNLRASGQRMFGRTQHALQRMQAGQRSGLRSVANMNPSGRRMSMPGSRMGQPSMMRTGGRLPTGARIAPPGTTPRPGMRSGAMPVPGAGNRPGGMMPGAGNRPGNTPVPGAGRCPNGTCPGGSCNGTGNCPGSQPGNGAGVGGHQWGRGTTGLGGPATMPNRTTTSRTVAGRQNTGGESIVRAISPQDHQEDAIKELRELQFSVIKAEEEALDAEPLPMRRREHVLRYFEQLRKHFEQQH